jgi:hypothetical protein
MILFLSGTVTSIGATYLYSSMDANMAYAATTPATISITSPTSGSTVDLVQGFAVTGKTTNIDLSRLVSIGVKAFSPTNSRDDIGYRYATSTDGFATWTVPVVKPTSSTQTRLVAKITYNSGSPVYSTLVDVVYGSAPAAPATITISSPRNGAILNLQGFTVTGITTNLNTGAVQSIGVKAVNPSNSVDDIGYVYATSSNGYATWTIASINPSSLTQTRLVAKITYSSGSPVYSTPVDVSYGSSPPPPPTPDTVPPDTAMTSVRDGSGVAIANGGSTSSATLTIVFTGSDNVGVSRFEGRLDNGPWNTVSSPLTLNVAQGAHDYDLRSVDAASNVDATPASTIWTVSGGNPPPPPPVDVDLPASVGPVLKATSLDSMFSLIATAAPGQWVELADGTYNNPTSRTISRSGVIVKAETVGGVTITGAPIEISGNNAWFHGFRLNNAASGDTMYVSGDGAHIVRNTFRMTGTGISEWLVVRADNVEVAYNDFGNKASQGTFVLHGTGSSHYTGLKMHHNYFHDHSGSGTPAEAYRIGSSQSAWLDFQAEVYNNRFERINGETELVTNKGSGINIHDNTFIDCNSSVTFRHGNNNRVENNVFIHTGLRIYGHGHVVRGNQIIDDSNNQLRQSLQIGAGTDANDSGSPGQPGSSNSIHSQVRDTIIENNIIVNTRNIGSLVSVQLGFSSITAPYPPIDNTIQNNIIYGTNTGILTGTDNNASWGSNTLSGNIVYGTGSATRGNMPSQNIDPLLQKDADGLYRFTANSPLTWNQSIRLMTEADVGPRS